MLGPTGQGNVERALNLPLLLAPLARLSLAHGAAKFHSDRVALSSTVGALAVFSSAGLLAAVGTLIILANTTLASFSTWETVAAATLLAAFVALEVGKALAWIDGDALAPNLAGLKQAGLRLVFLSVGALAGVLTAGRIVVLVVLAWIIATGFFTRSQVKKLARPVQFTFEWHALAAFGRVIGPVSINLVVVGLLLRSDILLLDHFDVSSADIGRYAVGVRLAEALWLVPLAVGQVFIVTEASHASETRPRVPKLASLAVVLVALIGATITFASWNLVPLVAPDYSAVPRYLALLLPGIALYAAVPILRNYMVLINRLGAMTACAFLALALNTALNVLLIPSYGASGAAVATSAAYSVLAGTLAFAISTDR